MQISSKIGSWDLWLFGTLQALHLWEILSGCQMESIGPYKTRGEGYISYWSHIALPKSQRRKRMEGSSKVFSTILMRIVFLLLLALIISPAESVNIAHDHPQTGNLTFLVFHFLPRGSVGNLGNKFVCFAFISILPWRGFCGGFHGKEEIHFGFLQDLIICF